METVPVLVLAPSLGRDLGFVAEVDPRVRLLEGEAGLGEAEVLLVGYPVAPDLAARAPRLAWVHHTQAGVSNLHGTDLWRSEVTLTSSRGSVAPTGIAEYVLAAAFHFLRGLHEAGRQKAAGEFSRAGYELATLAGATMGVVGLGGIGGEVARLARAVGMRVVATRRSAGAPRVDVDGVDLLLPADRLAELAAQSDVVAVCAQLTAESRGLVDARVLAAMKPTAVLVNVARGEVVDEDALVRALAAGRSAAPRSTSTTASSRVARRDGSCSSCRRCS